MAFIVYSNLETIFKLHMKLYQTDLFLCFLLFLFQFSYIKTKRQELVKV